MPIRLSRLLLALSAVGKSIAPSSCHAATAKSLDFRSMEYRYEGDDAFSKGKAEIIGAIAVGSPLADSTLLLRTAGARCKAVRRQLGTVRCFYNQMSFDGDALDEVRWTTILQSEGDLVTAVRVRRETGTRVIS